MYKLDPKFLKELLKGVSRTMVGRLCNQIEVLQKKHNPDSEVYKELETAKSFHRELVYQAFRDLENHVKFYNEGRLYENYKIYNPNSSPKDE